MNSNYEWQKNQVNERIQARLQEAETHRQAKEANSLNRPFSGWTFSIFLAIGIIVVVWLLVGCAPISEVSAVSIDVVVPRTELVHGQDSTAGIWSMAERIRFQDKREAYLDWRTSTESTMAE